MNIEYNERTGPFVPIFSENFVSTFNLSPGLRFVNTEIVFRARFFLFSTNLLPEFCILSTKLRKFSQKRRFALANIGRFFYHYFYITFSGGIFLSQTAAMSADR